MRKIFTIIIFLFLSLQGFSQLKYVVEDFEGFAIDQADMKREGIFSYGSATTLIDQKISTGYGYSGNRALKVSWNQRKTFGGWGKGITRFVDLKQEEDYLNFYIYNPKSNRRNNQLKIILQEDDNGNSTFDETMDDAWFDTISVKSADEWQKISIPLLRLKRANYGGDGKFNVNHLEGKLLTFLISFNDSNNIRNFETWYFDFVSFSKGPLPTWSGKFIPPPADKQASCYLGAWSEEGLEGNYLEIPFRFENMFKGEGDKKLAVAHFFTPFSIGGLNGKQLLPNPEKINWLVDKGYLPMITLEHQHIKVKRKEKQPNLYSIVEGHYDHLFKEWAEKIKQVKGPVLLRILHEFNGDWYPWSISKNDNNPQLYVKAYRHIWNIFKQSGVQNVKFVWCSNSTSFPQESWNNILDSYPGNQYVDCVGLDVYNGAGEKALPNWTSFRSEATQSYFTLTQSFPDKPLLLCEVSSRERKNVEKGDLQTKAGWIAQMSEAIKSDFSQVKLLSWFNQKEFMVNTSNEAKNAYSKFIWMDSYFKSGKEGLLK